MYKRLQKQPVSLKKSRLSSIRSINFANFSFLKKMFSLIKFSLNLHLQNIATYSCFAAAKSFAENSIKFDARGIDFDERGKERRERERLFFNRIFVIRLSARPGMFYPDAPSAIHSRPFFKRFDSHVMVMSCQMWRSWLKTHNSVILSKIIEYQREVTHFFIYLHFIPAKFFFSLTQSNTSEKISHRVIK